MPGVSAFHSPLSLISQKEQLQRELPLLGSGGHGGPRFIVAEIGCDKARPSHGRGTRGAEVKTHPGLRPPLLRGDGFPPEFTLWAKTTKLNRCFWAPPENSDWKEECRGEFPSAGAWGDPRKNLWAGRVGSPMPDCPREGNVDSGSTRNDMIRGLFTLWAKTTKLKRCFWASHFP